jgi:DNA-binding NarL/FixJ family response regulator
MNGLERLKQLSIKSSKNKVVICRASRSNNNIRQTIEGGAEGFLVKRVTPISLVSLLHRLGFNKRFDVPLHYPPFMDNTFKLLKIFIGDK